MSHPPAIMDSNKGNKLEIIKQGQSYSPSTDSFPWKSDTRYLDTETGDVFYVETVRLFSLTIDHPKLNAKGWPVEVVRGSMDSTYVELS